MPVHPTFVLVHGSWHDGHCWSRVRAHLSTAGYPSIAPTLPGHGAGDDRASVTHDDYVAAIDAALDTVHGPVVLVGHSFGGSVIARIAELQPERCAGLVYYSAFVPRDGERVADSLPAPFIEFLDAAAAASVDRSVALPYELFRDTFANTADEPAASSLHTTLVPEPHGPIFEPVTLPTNAREAIPTTYIACRNDRALPPGSFHPGQSGRLPSCTLIEIDGDHEVLLTAPERLALGVAAVLRARRGQRARRKPSRSHRNVRATTRRLVNLARRISSGCEPGHCRYPHRGAHGKEPAHAARQHRRVQAEPARPQR